MLDVRSEVGRLRSVLVHEPGPEVDLMVPSMMEDLLFDDILYGDRAREEHARFRRVLQLLGVEVLDAQDLLEEALREDGARAWVADHPLADLSAEARRRIGDLPPEALALALVGGSRRREDQDAFAPEALFDLPPLPNWCFQRDPQIVLGDGVIFSSMAAPARRRESVLARLLFRFHPRLVGSRVLLDPADPPPPPPRGRRPARIEGGDVLVLSPEVVAIGVSERTTREGLREFASAMALVEDRPRWLLVVQIPRRRAYMHLDTLITAVDRDLCLAFPPVVLGHGSERARVHEIDLHARTPRFSPRKDLLSALDRRGVGMEPIPCGGPDPVSQQREQWTDGANTLAVAPGLILLYDRNVATIDELDRRGFAIVTAEDLLLGREEVEIDAPKRTCVVLSSHELSRARGGPHCLSHPLVREPLG